MRYKITKLFKMKNGRVHSAEATFTRDRGQMRKINGSIGGPEIDGEYNMDLVGEGNITIECESDTVLHIEPVVEDWHTR
jgi:hypothetical protein